MRTTVTTFLLCGLLGLPGLVLGQKTVITPGADLALTMTGPATVSQGGGVSYSLTVRNNSTTQTATNVRVTIPNGGVALGSYSVPGGYCNIGGGATCFLNAIAAGGSVTFTVSGAAVTVGTATLTATVSANTADPNPSNNSAAATTVITPGADLVLTMTGPAQMVGPTWAFAYKITVQNLGPAASTNAIVEDVLPNVFGTYHAKASSSVGTCSVDQVAGVGGFTYSDRVRCNLGALAAGATVTVTINEQWSGGGPAGPVTNTATVTSANGDIAPANNSASTTIVFGAADVSVALSGPATAVAPIRTSITPSRCRTRDPKRSREPTSTSNYRG
jgi:uncharacterized repeat protein (TIGR01451 family)